MKPQLAIFFLGLLVACAHGALMTHEDYAEVRVGTPIEEVEKQYGPPVQIRADGEQFVYEYIERVKMGTNTIEMRKYYFVVKGGKIVSKSMRSSNPPPYEDIYSDDLFPDQGG